MVIGPFILPLLLGVVVWISGKFVSATEQIGQACMIATYALIPRILDTALRVGQAFFMDPASLNGQARVTLSAARFLDPDTTSAGLIAILSRFDVFTIWCTILIGIGISVVARIPRARGMIAAVIVWVIATLSRAVPGDSRGLIDRRAKKSAASHRRRGAFSIYRRRVTSWLDCAVLHRLALAADEERVVKQCGNYSRR